MAIEFLSFDQALKELLLVFIIFVIVLLKELKHMYTIHIIRDP